MSKPTLEEIKAATKKRREAKRNGIVKLRKQTNEKTLSGDFYFNGDLKILKKIRRK